VYYSLPEARSGAYSHYHPMVPNIQQMLKIFSNKIGKIMFFKLPGIKTTKLEEPEAM